MLRGMTPDAAAPFIVPTLGSTLTFSAIVTAVATAIVVGLTWNEPDPATERRWSRIGGLAMLGWLVLTVAIPVSGVLKAAPLAVMLLPALSLVVAVAVAASVAGARLAALPMGLLVGFHAFRLPLEIVLHDWYGTGSLPVQMTWEGQNFDVLTGGLGLVLGALALWRPLPNVVVWAFNVVGLGLLINVVRIAATSVPTPLRQFANDPPVWLPYHPPYAWIVSVCVAGALLGHLVLFRKLLQRG